MNTQKTQGDITQQANQAKASLAFATHLQTQMMQHQAPPKPEEAPMEEAMNETEPKEPEVGMKAEMESMKAEFEKKLEDLKKGITEDIKADIAEALQQDAESES